MGYGVTALTNPDVFAAAAIRLCAALWVECDTIGSLVDGQGTRLSRERLANRLQAFRLELVLILDHCAGRWITQLDPWQRAWLVATTHALLEDLDEIDGDPLPHEPLARAQDRLLDAIIEQCAHPEGSAMPGDGRAPADRRLAKAPHLCICCSHLVCAASAA